jgi:drug/metabolite transporter (DMT)-like permease
MTPRTATLTGFIAILLWSTLAVFTAMTGPVPPFQTVAMTFVIGGLLILAFAAARGRLHLARPTWASLGLGILGPFGDTALYFAALKLAPPAQANLIHYLWPLLIVLFATQLPGGRLKPAHQGQSALLGYGLAAFGAVLWAAYSVLSRRLASVPTESVGVTNLACAALALMCHFAFETTIWPSNASEWVGIAGLGIGSIGIAFICWDIGMKRGDVSLLGVASYAAPVLSTLVLVAAGHAEAGWLITLSCLLIVLGAVVASWSEIRLAMVAGKLKQP